MGIGIIGIRAVPYMTLRHHLGNPVIVEPGRTLWSRGDADGAIQSVAGGLLEIRVQSRPIENAFGALDLRPSFPDHHPLVVRNVREVFVEGLVVIDLQPDPVALRPRPSRAARG